jgi:hypothetical protein
VDPAVQTTAITKAARYATHGLIAGALIVLVGAILIVLGFTGPLTSRSRTTTHAATSRPARSAWLSCSWEARS